MSAVTAARPVEASIGRFLALALPVMAANITEPLIGIVDTAAIGQLGEVSLLGAVALSAVLFEFLFWGLGSLRMSTAGLTAQALGAGDDREIAIALGRALLLALFLGGLLVILQKPIIVLAMMVFTPSANVAEAAQTYIAIRIWSAPFALMNYAILGSLVGQGRTGIGLFVQVAINLTKIALTILAVSIFKGGIAGAAIATVIAEFIGACLGLIVSMRLGALRRDMSWREIFQPTALGRMLAVNRDNRRQLSVTRIGQHLPQRRSFLHRRRTPRRWGWACRMNGGRRLTMHSASSCTNWRLYYRQRLKFLLKPPMPCTAH